MSVEINTISMNKKISRSKVPRVEERVRKTIEAKFNNAKKEMMDDVYNQSSALGLDSNNSFLRGALGFTKNSSPVIQLVVAIDEETQFPEQNGRKTRDKQVYAYTYTVPTLDSIERKTPTDWDSGISWVSLIERGISNISQFLYSISKKRGRSGAGIQVKGKTGATYSGSGFVSDIIARFKARLLEKTIK